MKNSSKWPAILLILFNLNKGVALASTESSQEVTVPMVEQDFFKWRHSDQGRNVSLQQMKKRCGEVSETQENLDCSLFVLNKIFQLKKANEIPEYYQAIKEKHSEVINREEKLKALFSMLGSESLSLLKETPVFSIKNSGANISLPSKPYFEDSYISEVAVPHVFVKGEDGDSVLFGLDTGATMTSVNYGTVDKLSVKMLVDSQYSVESLYGKKIPSKLGIVPFLNIGGVEFKNILVFVNDQDSVVGLDLIAKLGRIKITKSSLEINSEVASRCDSRVVYHQPIDNLNQSLNFAVLLDDKPAMAIIDTGNNEYISTSVLDDDTNEPLANAIDEMQVDNVTGFKYKKIAGVLTLPQHTIDVQYKYYPEFTIPFSRLFGGDVPSLLIGWQMFDDFELHLDIESGRSCFNKV